jgi:hypothetical protein
LVLSACTTRTTILAAGTDADVPSPAVAGPNDSSSDPGSDAGEAFDAPSHAHADAHPAPEAAAIDDAALPPADALVTSDTSPPLGQYLDPCDHQACAPGLVCASYDANARPFCTVACDPDAGTTQCAGLPSYAFCIGSYCATYCDARSGNPACPAIDSCDALTDTGAGVCVPR